MVMVDKMVVLHTPTSQDQLLRLRHLTELSSTTMTTQTVTQISMRQPTVTTVALMLPQQTHSMLPAHLETWTRI